MKQYDLGLQLPQLAEHSFNFTPKEFKIVGLRDCPMDNPVLGDPAPCVRYWRDHVTRHPFYNPEVETLVVLLLNTRKRLKGHHLVATGTMDTILCHPREVFRAACIAPAAAIVLMHNHPSGDPSPSEADVKITRDLIRAGQVLKIELIDHIVIGQTSTANAHGFCSLREQGCFYN